MATSSTSRSARRGVRRGAKPRETVMDQTSTSVSDKRVGKKSSSSSKRANAQQRLRSARARFSWLGIRLSLLVFAAVAVGAGRVGAYPMPLKPLPKPSPSPTAPPLNVLPFDSTLLFVLDDPISSRSSKAGQIVRVHLKSS